MGDCPGKGDPLPPGWRSAICYVSPLGKSQWDKPTRCNQTLDRFTENKCTKCERELCEGCFSIFGLESAGHNMKVGLCNKHCVCEGEHVNKVCCNPFKRHATRFSERECEQNMCEQSKSTICFFCTAACPERAEALEK